MSPEHAAPARTCAPIGDGEAVGLLRRMVSIPSLSGSESVLACDLAQVMDRLGLRASIDDAGNAVGVRGPEDAHRTIVLLGHMDTVPGHVPVRVENGRLFGRGTVDAKGPLAAFVVGAASVALPPGVRVEVIGAVEEECATSRGARHVARRPVRPDACIIGEPSAWDGVTLGYKGRLLVECTARQPAAHTAGPGPSASDRVIAWWAQVRGRVEAVNAGVERVFDRVQHTVRSLGSSGDGLEETSTLVASFRLPPSTDPGAIEALCREHAGTLELVCLGHERAHVADRSNPVVRALSGAIRASGSRPTLRLKTGTSDMNVVGPAWNCPIAAYGPGDSALDHTPYEHIVIDEYLRGCRVVADALERLAAELSGA